VPLKSKRSGLSDDSQESYIGLQDLDSDSEIDDIAETREPSNQLTSGKGASSSKDMRKKLVQDRLTHEWSLQLVGAISRTCRLAAIALACTQLGRQALFTTAVHGTSDAAVIVGL